MNPADAHMHAEGPPDSELRVIILCSVAVPKVPGDDGSEDPVNLSSLFMGYILT